MEISLNEAERLARSGAEALRAGRAAEARRFLGQLTATGRANAQIWLMLATACKLLGHYSEMERAADEVLAHDRRSLRALIMKADARRAAGDPRAASSFYKAASQTATGLGTLPADLAEEMKRADRVAQELASGYRNELVDHLSARGVSGETAGARFWESVEILLGEKQVYLQQPTAYYFPGLPPIQFYEREDFSWVPALEAAFGEIRAELEAGQREKALFRPYLQARADRPRQDFHGLLDNPAWSTLYLWENGAPVEANVARFPKTFAAVRDLPLPHITTRAPSILFSLLQPGARIQPHHGMINTRLICHLPLIVPEGCAFRVGNEIRRWEEGKLLIFDDTIEHEAWNDSDEDRIILIFDIWRPELTAEERHAVTEIFEAIDRPDK